MVDMFPVLRVLGILIMIFALTMGLPLAVSLWTGDGVWHVYPLSMGATLLAAGLSALMIALTRLGQGHGLAEPSTLMLFGGSAGVGTRFK